MNETIQTILNHRSVRSLTNQLLTDEQIRIIVNSAQAAATSSFVQAYTIIGIKDQSKKEKLAVLSGNQSYVSENGHFFVFCLDLHRLTLAAEMEDVPSDETYRALTSTETFMVGVIDTSLAAQNAVIAAESMGLGICYIGGIRNQLDEVSQLLQTPNHVIPLFGLSVGYPADLPDQKPRLPYLNVYHEDEYNQDDQQLIDQLQQYNNEISAYYADRTNGRRKDRWTEAMAKLLTHPKRLYMKDFLNKKGFPLE
ncbi:FMN reductase (NADPH) [Paenibacillus baekrokdamisoli]|uniref:FMN reductase (NADPH) n=1 Tax=Paenibacillus baekrokdamisoli TaxID=1712516 RepID=A0A3G9JBV2_9BACL|nr:oxygen-insensitive NADPH nitroreductase [Paenibacillus baekrokdamisoli]MBB3072429.1 FMN reductase (NADPH) [Paenibacillus baekrokdamisoli]BBH20489.1 FMN reductase (NADPH) [Paenibacillus baekrokdamisoli]